MREIENDRDRFDVAVVGMAGRFPGARSLKEFWTNLSQGRESLRIFSDQELLARGVEASKLQDAGFVKAGSVLDEIDLFAARLFGYSPREAQLMDPQHRFFLECAWEALEDAGYAPRHVRVPVGVFASSSLSAYLLFNLIEDQKTGHEDESFQTMIGTDKDFLGTRVSYKLNLTGPSISIQSGCSSSLVAISLAVQSLLTFQCDMALAGGVSINVPQRTGYFYQPGGITSPDGKCHPFAANAQGTVFGDGVGIVVLKRVEDALEDGDQIYAVVRGVAVNNDGAGKVGYTAPSVSGQAEVISRAQRVAGITAGSVSYIEAHGTATALGDPNEVAALTRVFQSSGNESRLCALGSVKGNIGHLDAAAGIAGFIKTVLMLQHRKLVPSLHFDAPNPHINFSGTSFYVNTSLKDWRSPTGILRAGVSSFGIGGTNAHVVLEQAPASSPGRCARKAHIITLSAESMDSLEKCKENVLRHTTEMAPELADIAYTLHVGREAFKYRAAFVCETSKELTTTLEPATMRQIYTGCAREAGCQVAFLFPGGGTQYPGMGKELYRSEPIFRNTVDACAELLQPILGCDVRRVIYPSEDSARNAAEILSKPSVGLPVVFAIEYAITMLLSSWGIRPKAMLGHSLGEYAAACVAGVFSIENALALVALRGQLFEELPAGAMLAVCLSEADVLDLRLEGISVAAINGPSYCVVSGSSDAIDHSKEVLQNCGIEFQLLHIHAAAHSPAVEAILDKLRLFLRKIPMNQPVIPFVSNVTGSWISPEDATDPDYWCQHLRRAVRFYDGLQTLMQNQECVLLEVGPGRTLSTLARSQGKDQSLPVFVSLRHPNDPDSEETVLYRTIARLWVLGGGVDWRAFHAHDNCKRVSLPTYPFERQRYWVAPRKLRPASSPMRESAEVDRWFYLPSWKRTSSGTSPRDASAKRWLIFGGESRMVDCLMERLTSENGTIVSALPGNEFTRTSRGFTLRSESIQDWAALFASMGLGEGERLKIVHLETLHEKQESEEVNVNSRNWSGFFSLLALTQAATQHSLRADVLVVTNRAAQITGSEHVSPEKWAMQAACLVIAQELEYIQCKFLDTDLFVSSPCGLDAVCDYIIREHSPIDTDCVAYRGLTRWIRHYEQVQLSDHPSGSLAIRGGVYLLTGGLGGIGLALAQELARTPCKIAFTCRRPFPDRHLWTKNSNSDRRQVIEVLESLEKAGCEAAVFCCDVADKARMRGVIHEIEGRFGSISGLFHLAGVTGEDALRLVSELDPTECDRQFRPKVSGLAVLDELFAGRNLDFRMAFSSNASILGGPGLLAYASASAFTDAYVSNSSIRGEPWTGVNWDAWLTQDERGVLSPELAQYALPTKDAMRALQRILVCGINGQVVVSRADLADRIREWSGLERQKATQSRGGATSRCRPKLSSDYVAARTSLEIEVATVWEQTLGLERVGLHDNFFELGGNSLIALRIVARLKKKLGRELRATLLFEAPTVAKLAQALSQRVEEKDDYGDSCNRGSSRRRRRELQVEAPPGTEHSGIRG